jgi:hypothetical protein
MNYIIHITCQVDSASAYARISSSTMTNASFVVAPYGSNASAAGSCHFSSIA